MTMDYKAMWEELKKFTQEEREFFRIEKIVMTDFTIRHAQDILADTVRFQTLTSVLKNMDDIEKERGIEQ